ncbi:MAG: AraC family transcriptional regulator [Luteolibacter sp.]
MKKNAPPSKRSVNAPSLPARQSEPGYFSSQVSSSNRFYLELKPKRSRELTVVSGGCEHCLPDYEVRRDGFPFLILEFISRGAGTLVMQGKTHNLRPGSVFVYGPGIAHQVTADPACAMSKFFVAFTGQGAIELLQECQMLPPWIVQVTHPERVEQVFDDLIQHGLSDHTNRSRMCNVALQYLVMKITDHSVPHGQLTTPAFATYQRCRKFIEENFVKLRTLRDVADACHVDHAYLCRLFQRFGRQSPIQYLQHLRMNHAADLLQNSQRMVKEVAEELGFSDPYNFSRAFKRVFRVYPGHLLRRQADMDFSEPKPDHVKTVEPK